MLKENGGRKIVSLTGYCKLWSGHFLCFEENMAWLELRNYMEPKKKGSGKKYTYLILRIKYPNEVTKQETYRETKAFTLHPSI